MEFKNVIIGVLSAVGSGIAWACGGWDTGMQTLIIFMAIDYILGLIVAVHGKSGKTETGVLDSRAGLKGILKKISMLLAVVLGASADRVLGTDGFSRTAVILFFCANEGLSVVENLALIGVPFPEKVKEKLEQLKND